MGALSMVIAVPLAVSARFSELNEGGCVCVRLIRSLTRGLNPSCGPLH
jgi:hypothetical protein